MINYCSLTTRDASAASVFVNPVERQEQYNQNLEGDNTCCQASLDMTLSSDNGILPTPVSTVKHTLDVEKGESPQFLMAPGMVPRDSVSLFDLIDEDFVICNTRLGFHSSNKRKRRGLKEGMGRTTILDQIDGLIREGDDTFMTSRSYPRGVRILRHTSRGRRNAIENDNGDEGRRQEQGKYLNSCFDLVVAKESFRYWEEEQTLRSREAKVLRRSSK
mmetsp:Transcript_17778/g.28712  ORF Transcript_17778/g.28712 Transcript_17778/m.28712 type:complete len:218 (-) Transcript_17778:391-1044(-)